MRHRLYRYFDKSEWAEAFLAGEVRFRPLSYYRDIEDEQVRRDIHEGQLIHRPDGGLVVHVKGEASPRPPMPRTLRATVLSARVLRFVMRLNFGGTIQSIRPILCSLWPMPKGVVP